MKNQTTPIEAAARRALDALNDLISNTTDPGVEALGARFELGRALIGVQPSPLDRAAARELSESERETLRFALDLAQEQMLSRVDEFTDDDEAAVDSLRRMAARKTVGHATVLETATAYEKPARRVLTPNEHDRAWHAIEGAAGAPDADPGTVLNAVLSALRIEAPTAEDEQAKCAKCRQLFDPADTRFDGKAQYAGTPYCEGCVDRCHDTEIADHRCVICA